MHRRTFLELAGTSALAPIVAGCDKLVLLGQANADVDPVTANDAFYVYECCGVPNVDPATHETAIRHEDTDLARITPAFLKTLTGRDKEHTLECIGANPRNQSISNAVWTGLPLSEVLDALGVAVPASAVGFRLTGADDYDAGVPIADLLGAPMWLVWGMNGDPLPLIHGAPARLLIPGRYGVKNLKWLDEIAFVDTPHVSWWTTRGWDEASTYKPNTLVRSPIEGTALRTGDKVRVVGTAFAGPDPVVRVEIRQDGGPWVDAVLDYVPDHDHVWVLWSWNWVAQAGSHTFQARCTTASGARSAPNPDGTDPWAGYDGSMEILLEVGGSIALLAAPALAGAWTREVGSAYGKAGVDVYDAFDYVAAGDAQAQGGSYFGEQYSLYGEVGALPGYKGQLSLKLPLGVGVHGSRADPAPCGEGPVRATTARVGDLDAAAQIALSPKLPLSAALEAKIPGYANGRVGDQYPACGALFPKPGDGQVDLTAWLYGGATPIAGGFVEGGVGYRYRSDWFVGWDKAERTVPDSQNRVVTIGFVDGVAFGAKIGQKLGKVLPIAGLDGVVNLRQRTLESQFTREYLTLSASALVDLAPGVALEPRLATELWSRDSSRGLAAGLGLSYRR